IRADAVSEVSLDGYNVIVIPDGNANALAGAIGDGGIGRLKDWVGRGGTLLCLDDASEFPTLKSVGLSSARAVGGKPPKKDDDSDNEDAKSDSTREDDRRPEYLPGSIFWASVDPRHFLAFGLDRPRIPVLMQGRLFLKPSKEGANPIVFNRDPLRVSG